MSAGVRGLLLNVVVRWESLRNIIESVKCEDISADRDFNPAKYFHLHLTSLPHKLSSKVKTNICQKRWKYFFICVVFPTYFIQTKYNKNPVSTFDCNTTFVWLTQKYITLHIPFRFHPQINIKDQQPQRSTL